MVYRLTALFKINNKFANFAAYKILSHLAACYT
jgi:hypothetical protein